MRNKIENTLWHKPNKSVESITAPIQLTELQLTSFCVLISIIFFSRVMYIYEFEFYFTLWPLSAVIVQSGKRKYSNNLNLNRISKQFSFRICMLCWFKINTLVSEHEIEIVSEKMLKKTESEILKFCYENKQNSSLLLNFFSHLLFGSSIH